MPLPQLPCAQNLRSLKQHSHISDRKHVLATRCESCVRWMPPRSEVLEYHPFQVMYHVNGTETSYDVTSAGIGKSCCSHASGVRLLKLEVIASATAKGSEANSNDPTNGNLLLLAWLVLGADEGGRCHHHDERGCCNQVQLQARTPSACVAETCGCKLW